VLSRSLDRCEQILSLIEPEDALEIGRLLE